MVHSTKFLTAAAGIAAMALSPASALAQTAYAIGNGGTTLIRFDVSDPSNVTTVGDFGGDNIFLDAIDFRPATGQLYGYLDGTDSFYTIDLNTAQLTLASSGASAAPTNTFQLGMDFNPTIDRARLVTDSNQNIVFNPNDGTAGGVTDLFYTSGDMNEDADPNIIDNAYTQSFAGAMSTTQYGIDYGLDMLVTIGNNAGTLTTVGSLGFDTGIFAGFDIYTDSSGVDFAYAILTGENAGAGGQAGLYSINLSTGAATMLGDVGFPSTQVYSLAVVPAPATLLMMTAPGLIGLRRKRR